MSIEDGDIARFAGVSTATLTMVLLKHGLRNVWLRGARAPAAGGGRVAGRAFTLRFIPAREDLATPAALASGRSTRVAIEAMPPGCIVVADAMGRTDAGIVGDILCARMKLRGVAALVTDGAVRDAPGIAGVGLPVWCQGSAAPPSLSALTFANWQEPVGCGGAAVFPDDIIVADQDGAVVVPRALAAAVLAAAAEQERLERWIMGEVVRGVPLPGLYPPDAAALERFRAARPQDA